MTVGDFALLRENTFMTYSGGGFTSPLEKGTPQHILLSEKECEVRVVTVPRVGRRELPAVIYHAVRRQSVNPPGFDAVDFEVMARDEEGIRAVAFVLRTELPENRKRVVTSYHILGEAIDRGVIPATATVIVEEEEALFCYRWKEGVLRSRTVYFPEDLKTLLEEEPYVISLTGDKAEWPEGVTVIASDDIASLQVSSKVFRKTDRTDSYIRTLIVGVLLFGIPLFLLWNTAARKIDKLESVQMKVRQLEKKRERLRTDRGVDEARYQAYKEYMEKRSDVYLLFSELYARGSDNMTLSSFTSGNTGFSISGICRDDAALEAAFRESPVLDNLEFSFTRAAGRITFRIGGNFSDE